MSLRAKRRRYILIAAGPTREKIDPIRFISNYSTGTFGFKIAREARRRGNIVTLVSGPTGLKAPQDVRFIQVESALDMRRALLREFPKADCVIMAAAISDWRAKSVEKKKIKRSANRRLGLVENPDILKELGKDKDGKILVGFSLDTEELEANAVKKLKEKNLDLIIANRLKSKSSAFGDRKIDVLMIDRLGDKTRFFNKSKEELADIILDKVEEFGI